MGGARSRRRIGDRNHRPQVGLANELRGIRHDADYRVRSAVQPDVTADETRLRVEARPPEGLAQHDDAGTLAVIVLRKRAPGDGPDAERIEDAGRDPLPRDGFRHAVGAAHHHSAHTAHEAANDLEAAAALGEIEEVVRGDALVCGGGGALRDHHRASGLGNRQGPEQRGVDEREDRAVGADAERQGEDGSRDEAGLTTERGQGIAEVLDEIAEQRSPRRPGLERLRRVGLAERSHVTGQRLGAEQFVHRQSAGVLVAGTAAPQLVVLQFEVLRQLLDDFGLTRGVEVQRGQSRPDVTGPLRHDPPP